MNFYYIAFNGYFPVGAVAVMKAESSEEALENFMAVLQEEEPHLVNDNITLTVEDVTLLTEDTKILLNGNY